MHHDRIKPCNDSSFPLWLQRKRHTLLNTGPMDDVESQDKDPDGPGEDSFPNGGLFDPDQTLPYMLGDDPDMTLPMLFGDNSFSDDRHLVEDTSGTANIPPGDSESDFDVEASNIHDPSEPRPTRAGRKTKLPARFRD